AKPSHRKRARRYLDKHIIPYDCSQTDTPSLDKMLNLTHGPNSSAPGHDGIPRTAFKRIPPAAPLFIKVMIETVKGFPVPVVFNVWLMIFIPEGSGPDDGISATKIATATRLLSLKNTDCKIVAAKGIEMTKPSAAKVAHGALKGLLPKHRFLELVAATDAQSRIAAMQDDSTNGDPMMVLCDFGDTFPSPCRTRPNIASEKADSPEGICNMMEATCPLPLAFANLAAVIECFGAIASGCPLGCPWSGTLWMVGLDPLIWDLHPWTAHPVGAVFGDCVDAAGSVPPSSKMLRLLSRVFFVAEYGARLVLKTAKTAKCKIIPLAGAVAPAVEDRVRDKIADLVPRWSDMLINDRAEYLGVRQGPSDDDGHSWGKVTLGGQRFTHKFAHIGAPTSTSLMLYNQRAVSKISYISQLLAWPRKVKKKESWALHRVWFLPPQALPRDALLAWGRWTSLKAVSHEHSNRSALMRSATVSALNWQFWARRLRGAVEFSLSFHARPHGLVAPLCWKSNPITYTLEEASQGFPSDTNRPLAVACAAALSEGKVEK
ncbi:unnamed protein product, partial [Prorocentrum cordatum]